MLNHQEFYHETKIPEATRTALHLYIHNGNLPGRFLTSVFENKLKQTYANADDCNLLAIPAIVHYLYNNAPSQCWGSPEAVTTWVEQKGMEGIDKVLPSFV